MVYTFENDSNWFDFVYEIGGQLILVFFKTRTGHSRTAANAS